MRKFQAVVCVQREWQKYTSSSHPLSKDKGLRGIGHNMSLGNLILGVSSVTVSCLIHYGSSLQNTIDIITKCDSYFITKCDRSLLQNASGVLLQNETVLLQKVTIITKCDVYYKLRQYRGKTWLTQTQIQRKTAKTSGKKMPGIISDSGNLYGGRL